MLTTPSNTAEEVVAFVNQFGIDKKVIIVFPMMHLPRTIMFIYAKWDCCNSSPTNFRVKHGINGL